MALLSSIPASCPWPAWRYQPGREIAHSVQAPSKRPTLTSSAPSPLFVGESLASEKGKDYHSTAVPAPAMAPVAEPMFCGGGRES